jgi:hypothetical protein
LCLWSEQFNVSPWGTLGTVTITPNATTSPSGIANADLILAADSFSSVNQIIAGATGVVYTNSFYIKNNNSTQSRLTIRNAITAVECNINWTGSELSGITNLTGVTTFQDVGDGWYRIISTYTALEAAQRPRFLTSILTANQSVYLWGAQLEAGAYPTSYIPTSSASVTRNADVIVKTGVADLIGQTEGTIYLQADIQKYNESGVYIGISRTPLLSESIYLQQASLNRLNLVVRTGGSTLTLVISDANWNAGMNKVAIAYNTTSTEIYVNGVTKGSLVTTAIPDCNQITLGSRPDTFASVGTGNYTQAALFPTRLTNAQLAALTA